MLRGLLKVAQCFLCSAHNLTLQSTELLAAASHELSNLRLCLAKVGFDSAVNYVHIHRGLS
jgi:hypothetical protein